MPGWFLNILATIGTLILTLSTTLIFNRLVGLPKELKKQKEAEKAKEEKLAQENKDRDNKIAALEAAVSALPSYRAQSLQIQNQLQDSDRKLLEVCTEIKNGVLDNQHTLNERLDRLEKREKNAIRAKLLDEYRLFTDETKNPMLAWSEMEHHAFFELVKDYEDLNGNDYVHSTVIPAMNELAVIPMSDKTALAKLMNSRKL
jgi:low affinity Fe/Cu permease